uniref:Protein tyrosine phosphatase receptor type F n=1 Tax=Nothoprocta perdicaria TaxID=30464 RepID=A0A8C6ZVY5_NOTPE
PRPRPAPGPWLELSKPTFMKAPEDQIGISGGVASFVCQATGEPKPRITWMKKGKKVSSQRFEVIEFDDGSGSVLRIQPLRVHRDEAIYECTATNSVGEINTSAKLTVLEEDHLPAGFPTIDMGPQLKVVEKARTATMLCAASGNPDPEISWFKDFLPVDTATSNGRIKQLRSGALQIENSEESDQGKYECVATNSAGTRYSAPANLYVRGKTAWSVKRAGWASRLSREGPCQCSRVSGNCSQAKPHRGDASVRGDAWVTGNTDRPGSESR